MAYDNSGFNGHEMQERGRNEARRTIEERGYTVYEGGRSNENRYVRELTSLRTFAFPSVGMPEVHAEVSLFWVFIFYKLRFRA